MPAGRGAAVETAAPPLPRSRQRAAMCAGAARLWCTSTLHDPVNSGPDAARVQRPVVLRPPAEFTDLDEHRETGRAQGGLQARMVPEVLALVPGHMDRTVRLAVHGVRGRLNVDGARRGAVSCRRWRGRRVAVHRHTERKTRGRRRTRRHACEPEATAVTAARTATGHDLLDRGAHRDAVQRILQHVEYASYICVVVAHGPTSRLSLVTRWPRRVATARDRWAVTVP